MARQRPDETKVMYNFDDLWENFEGEPCMLFCLSERDVNIIQSSLRFARWASRWEGNIIALQPGQERLLRSTGRFEDLVEALEYTEALIGRLNMSCSEDFKEGLVAVANSIALLASQGGGNCGPTDGNGVSVYCYGSSPGASATGVPPTSSSADTGSETPPDGFDDWDSFVSYRCNVAAYILNGITSTLSLWTTLNLVSATTLPVVAVFIPGVGIAIALGILLAAAAVHYTALSNLLELLADDENERQLLCAMTNGDTVDEVYEATTAKMVELIEDYTADPIMRFFMEGIFRVFLYFDNLNRLFEFDASVTYPEVDCPDCDTDCTLFYDPVYHTGGGAEPEYPGGLIDSVSLMPTSNNNQAIRINLNDCPDQLFTITDFNLTGGSWSDPTTHPLEVFYDLPTGGTFAFNLRAATLPIVDEGVLGGGRWWVTSVDDTLEFDVTCTFEDA